MYIETVREAELFWLNATNIALGAVVLVCAVILGGAIVQSVLQRWRAMREIDRDLHGLERQSGPHAFEVPGLGLTMADGGEPVQDPHNKDGR